jgi:hypothetical protein
LGPTAPTRINDRGQIVGLYSDNAPNTKDPDAIVHGFVLDRRKVTTIDFPGAAAPGTVATDINNRSQIVGFYYRNPDAGTGRARRSSGDPPRRGEMPLVGAALDQPS